MLLVSGAWVVVDVLDVSGAWVVVDVLSVVGSTVVAAVVVVFFVLGIAGGKTVTASGLLRGNSAVSPSYEKRNEKVQ